MNIRAATATDSPRIRTIAEKSFESSYAFSPLDIESIVETDFDTDAIEAWVDDDDRLLFVVEAEDSLLGFTQARITDDQHGEIVWLHVDPTVRGQGVGTELIDRVLAALRERAVERVQATILAQNQEGGEFLESFGFQQSGQEERTFGGEQFRTEVYSTVESDRIDDEHVITESGEVAIDGETRFIDPEKAIAGDEGEFLLVFAEKDEDERMGFYCTNCGSISNLVDTDGKVVCESCGNVHNPDEWDESYL